MIERRPYDIDMRPDGTFVEQARQNRGAGWMPPPGGRGGLSRGLALGAVILGSAIVAGLALSIALVLVPIAIGAALIGYVALRLQLWRMRRNGTTMASMAGGFGPLMARFETIIRAQKARR